MSNLTKSKEIPAIRVNTGRRQGRVVWQSRYEGCAAVAYVNGRAIAGISGPWSDKYALTWWEASTRARQLELFDSLEAAKRDVEQRTPRKRLLSDLLDVLRRHSASAAGPSWLVHVRALLRGRIRQHSQRRSASDTVAQLRQYRLLQETDLSGMHFHAFD